MRHVAANNLFGIRVLEKSTVLHKLLPINHLCTFASLCGIVEGLFKLPSIFDLFILANCVGLRLRVPSVGFFSVNETA